jgi:C-terminal processing protease CtpA/Prc
MNDGSFRDLFSQVFGYHSDKKALIVDTRFNGGGWLTEDLTSFLSGEAFLRFYPREQEKIGGEPFFRWDRPSAVIMGEGNYSDAHIFPYAYKTLGIGKLVGMPVPGTGTAVWWEHLIDQEILFGIPQTSTLDTQGNYLENTQLEPDLKVANTPENRQAGKDRQLEAAVKHLLTLPDPKPWIKPKK